MTDAALEDGIALLDELPGIVVLGGHGLLDLPIMAGGGDSLGLCLIAKGAGQEPGAGNGTGGGGGAGLGPGVVAGGRGVGAGILYQVVDIIGGVTLNDSNVLVAVSNGRGGAVVQGEVISTGGVVVLPIGDVAGGVGDGIIDGVVRLVDDSVPLDFGNFAVVTDDAVVAGDGRGAGVDVVGVAG